METGRQTPCSIAMAAVAGGSMNTCLRKGSNPVQLGLRYRMNAPDSCNQIAKS
jgi:hypothetical protein